MTDRSNVREQIAHYSKQASRFERSVWSLGKRDNRNHLVKVRAIAHAIAANDGGRVLEVGTGTGLHAAWLLEHTPVSITAVDASGAMLGIAGRRLQPFAGRAALGIADANGLPFPDGAFDASFCSGTLHHLSTPGRGVAELARVTRPGGRVAAMEPNWKFPSVMLSGVIPAERNVFKINPAALEAWARAAGLVDVGVQRLLYTPPSPQSWTRAWDAVDRRLGRVPGIRRLSIMLLLTGRVPG